MNKSYDVYMCRVQKRELHEEDQYLSPFDRMPSKLEMQGMKEIFKREYCGRFESEESV